MHITSGSVPANQIGISNTNADNYFLWAGNINPSLAPFSVKKNGDITATRIHLGNSNIDEFTQMWGWQFADNANGSHPASMSIYVPSDISGIKSMKLSFKAEAFRAFSVGASDGGSTSSLSGGGITATTEDGGGQTKTSSGGSGESSSTVSDSSIGGNSISIVVQEGTYDGYTGPGGTESTGGKTLSTGGADPYETTTPTNVNTGKAGTGATGSTSGGISGSMTLAKDTGKAGTGGTGGPSSDTTSTLPSSYDAGSGWGQTSGGAATSTNYTTPTFAGLSGSEIGTNYHKHGSGTYAVGSHNHSITQHYHTIGHSHTLSAHTHTGPEHTHSITDHYHATPSVAHTHTGPEHTHPIGDHKHSFGHTHGIPEHTHTGGEHSHTMFHTHTVTLPNFTIPGHAHTVKDHKHNVTIDAHNHSLTIEGHTHEIEEHTHGIVYGIYSDWSNTATSCTVYVDGSNIGSFSSLTSSDITAYLSKSGGKITRNTYHTITITPNKLTRIVADVFVIGVVARADDAIY